MHTFIRSANEIDGDPRRWLESGLGQRLEQNQRVMIALLNEDIEPDEDARREAREGLRSIRAEAAANIEAQGLSPDEVDAVVDEAIEDLRRRQP